MFDRLDVARSRYAEWMEEGVRAGACLECMDCEELCPQHIPISEWMPRIHEALG